MLSPQAQAAVDAIRHRERNRQGALALAHLKAAQARIREHRRRRAAHDALQAATPERYVPPSVAYHHGNTDRVHRYVHGHRLCTTRDVVNHTGLSQGQVTNILWRLQTQGQVDREIRTDGGGRRAHWYATRDAT